MKRIFILLCLITCVLFPNSAAQPTGESNWEIDLNNGYISTKPLFVGDQIIVRTSGFWTGDDRPHVYAFDQETGQENWRYLNQNSTNHDMSPLLHVGAGGGDCGNWNEMIIVGWTDGKVTALDVEDGSLIWSSQTEVVTWGITGKMALDDDNLIVPTRKGLSSFCLSDGTENLRVDLPQLGWRNGVTVTEYSYLLGNEEGVLNIVNKSGEVNNLSIGDGMIRHAPIVTSAGIIIHLQTSNGSEIYLGSELISEEGHSPAIPFQLGESIFFGTSDSVSAWKCGLTCQFEGRTPFHTNGEITAQIIGNDTHIWFPKNTAEGGWGFGIPGQDLAIYSTDHDTYVTAGVGFGPNGLVAFGNDAGVLMVVSDLFNETATTNQSDEHTLTDDTNQSNELVDLIISNEGVCEMNSEEDKESFELSAMHLLVFALIAGVVVSYSKGNRELVTKLAVLLLLVVSIMALSSVSQIWSEEVANLQGTPGDWNEDWPEEWKDTQIVVFELPDGDLVIGGCSGHVNVEQLTESAATELGIEIEKEQFSIGEMIVSFNGHELNGWEFTVDGTKSQVGISESGVEEDSVVRWSAA